MSKFFIIGFGLVALSFGAILVSHQPVFFHNSSVLGAESDPNTLTVTARIDAYSPLPNGRYRVAYTYTVSNLSAEVLTMDSSLVYWATTTGPFTNFTVNRAFGGIVATNFAFNGVSIPQIFPAGTQVPAGQNAEAFVTIDADYNPELPFTTFIEVAGKTATKEVSASSGSTTPSVPSTTPTTTPTNPQPSNSGSNTSTPPTTTPSTPTVPAPPKPKLTKEEKAKIKAERAARKAERERKKAERAARQAERARKQAEREAKNPKPTIPPAVPPAAPSTTPSDNSQGAQQPAALSVSGSASATFRLPVSPFIESEASEQEVEEPEYVPQTPEEAEYLEELDNEEEQEWENHNFAPEMLAQLGTDNTPENPMDNFGNAGGFTYPGPQVLGLTGKQ